MTDLPTIKFADEPSLQSDSHIEIVGRTKWPRAGESIYFRDPDEHLVELLTPGLWSFY